MICCVYVRWVYSSSIDPITWKLHPSHAFAVAPHLKLVRLGMTVWYIDIYDSSGPSKYHFPSLSFRVVYASESDLSL